VASPSAQHGPNGRRQRLPTRFARVRKRLGQQRSKASPQGDKIKVHENPMGKRIRRRASQPKQGRERPRRAARYPRRTNAKLPRRKNQGTQAENKQFSLAAARARAIRHSCKQRQHSNQDGSFIAFRDVQTWALCIFQLIAPSHDVYFYAWLARSPARCAVATRTEITRKGLSEKPGMTADF